MGRELKTDLDATVRGNFGVELMFGEIIGGEHDNNSLLKGILTRWANTYMLQMPIKYYPHLDELFSGWPKKLRPYVLAGPEVMLASLGQHGPAVGPQRTTTKTGFMAGGLMGGGIKVQSWLVDLPNFASFFVTPGAEWRYNVNGNGREFNQIMASISISFPPGGVAPWRASLSPARGKELFSPRWNFGLRTGWAESPWPRRPGGVFIGGYLSREISTALDSTIGGNLGEELMFATLAGGQRTLAGQPPIKFRLGNTYMLQAVVQYYPHLDQAFPRWPRNLRPYLLAGPEAMLGSLLRHGRSVGPPTTTTDTAFMAGGAVGAGLKTRPFWSDSPSYPTLLQRLMLGSEWRFNQNGNGISFNQITGVIAFAF